MTYTHLSIEEREKIQELLWKKTSIRAIAQELGRSPSSISREIKKNESKIQKKYTPRQANNRALEKRKNRGRTQRLKNEKIRQYVIEKLKLRWSPEQIAGRISFELPEHSISHEAIYQFIYAQIHRKGYGYLKPGGIELRHHLRRRKKRRTHLGMRKTKKLSRFNGTSIEERPSVVDRRTRLGDWETDTVESLRGKAGVNTLLERKSGLYFITKLKSSKAPNTTEAIISRLKDMPVYTVTLDNGSENAGWRELEATLKTKTYYCHPYCSGERGSNENTNGLLRDYFPKKTDFTTIKEEELDYVEYLLNTRPRKRLNYKTPLEVFKEGVALEGGIHRFKH
jgi:IS30 family transposase